MIPEAVRKYVYYEEPDIVLLHGDCLEILPLLEPESVDLVITDPPYGSGGRDGAVHLSGNDTMHGNRLCSEAFIWMTRTYSQQLFKGLKQSSHCYVFSDWRKYKDVQIAHETTGWELRSLIVWDKGTGMGEFWRSSHEFILFFTKRKPKKLSHGGCFNVLPLTPVRTNKKHAAEKPTELIEYVITASSSENDTVLDPFLGSGTTAVACKTLGRKCIGIEIESKYLDIAIERLKQGVLLGA